MSGVRVGTRLEQLQDLRRQTAVQHEHARRTGAPAADLGALLARIDVEIRAEGGTPPPAPRPPAPDAPRRRTSLTSDDAVRVMAELGVTSNDVKRWAVDQGLLDAVKRGRIRVDLVETYARHHQHQVGEVPAESENQG